MLLGGAASGQQKMDAHAASEITWANNGEFVCLISLENDTLSPRLIAFWSNVVRSIQRRAEFCFREFRQALYAEVAELLYDLRRDRSARNQVGS